MVALSGDSNNILELYLWFMGYIELLPDRVKIYNNNCENSLWRGEFESSNAHGYGEKETFPLRSSLDPSL